MVAVQTQSAEFLPLRGLANVLTVLLSVVVATVATRLVILALNLGSGHSPHGFFGHGLDNVADITIFGLGILFVVWFRRARINAESHDYPQRRARGWTFWGWVVPIVNIWFPFQLMGDIWRAGLPSERRRRTAWLPALWWTCWLLSGLSFGHDAMSAYSGPSPHVSGNSNAVSLVFLAIAGALLVRIVRVVSDGPVGWPYLADAGPAAAGPLLDY